MKKLVVKYFGKLGNIDNKLLTIAIQKGYLSKITENANDLNSPAKMKHLGIEVESVNTNADADYSELVEVDVVFENGAVQNLAGTVMGKIAKPVVVQIGAYKVAANLNNKCALMLKNNDTPGMVGIIGTSLGKHNCNIANMSLSRMDGGVALSVYELDNIPTADVIRELDGLKNVEAVKVVDLS